MSKSIESYINKIHCADCLELMADFPDNSVDLVVTSPPYDNLREYKGYSFDFEGIAKQLYRIIKVGGVVVWVVNDATVNGSETGASFRQALYFMELGFNLHDTMIYEKTGIPFPEKVRYNQIFEYMFVLSKLKPAVANLIKQPTLADSRKKRFSTFRQSDGSMQGADIVNCSKMPRTNVWRYATGYGHSAVDLAAHQHPAIFPEQLAIDHIKSWSNPNDLVIDPMTGSGTTCVAAKMLGRRYIGIDISSDYCKIARKRIAAAEKGITVKELEKGQKVLF